MISKIASRFATYLARTENTWQARLTSSPALCWAHTKRICQGRLFRTLLGTHRNAHVEWDYLQHSYFIWHAQNALVKWDWLQVLCTIRHAHKTHILSKKVSNRFFGIRDWTYLNAGIREFKVRFWGAGFGKLKQTKNRSVRWREFMKKSIFSVREKDQANRRRSDCHCAGMKIIFKAKLPIYQKSSMVHRETRQIRLLRQLKCLTASLRIIHKWRS